MKKFTFENQGTNTYMVYQVGIDEEVDSMSLGMITNNNILGLAPTIFMQQDSTKYFRYNVSSKISADQFLMGMVNKKRIIGVFSGIVNAMLSVEEYMLDTNSICLDLKYIFTDVTTCETVLICLPILDLEAPPVDLKTFFKNIVFSVQFDQTESGDYIAKLINYLNRASTFSLYEFKEVLDEIEHGVTTKPTPQSAQQASPQMQTQTMQQASPQVQSQVNMQNNVPQMQSQPVVEQRVTQIPVSESVAVKKQENINSAQIANSGFAIPSQNADNVSGQNLENASGQMNQTVSSDEKEISWLYLIRHYDKETAATYKAQQEAKKAAKATGNTAKVDKKKEKEEKKNKKKEDAAPASTPSVGFAIPGQAPQSVSQQTTPTSNDSFAIPGQRQTSVLSSEQQSMMTESVPTLQPTAAPPMSQMYQMPQMQVHTSTSMNFGETTVLSGAGIGETTVLGAMPTVIESVPHLIRSKNNERIMVNKPVFRIGKERSFVDYFIGDNTAISRSHANIITRDGEYFVQDTNSTNHTYVDGQMIQSNIEFPISQGTKIRLANEDFEFRIY